MPQNLPAACLPVLLSMLLAVTLQRGEVKEEWRSESEENTTYNLLTYSQCI